MNMLEKLPQIMYAPDDLGGGATDDEAMKDSAGAPDDEAAKDSAGEPDAQKTGSVASADEKANGDAAAKKAGDDDSGSVLSEQDKDKSKDAPPEVTDQIVEEYIGKIKFTGSDGKDIELDQDVLRAIAPELIRGKVPNDVATRAIMAFNNSVMKKEVAAEEEYMKNLKQMRADTQKEFGNDLSAIVSQANAGGAHLFGNSWNLLREVPEFCNNPDVLRGLASVGRSIADDKGAGGDGSSDSSTREFSAERWIEGSNARR